ncbi:MAG: flagellar export protein FliJ [Anaerolineae bacterium]|nr:flagellar export protein FliJ [Anaerolineae bacterium]
MGRSRFRLEPVLSYRESVVEARELELAKAIQAQVRAEHALHALRKERARALKMVRNMHRAARIDPLKLTAAESYLTRLEADLERQGATVRELAQRTEQCRVTLHEALKDKKKIEHLKEQEEQRRAWEEARAEQAQLDELSTVQYNRRKVV